MAMSRERAPSSGETFSSKRAYFSPDPYRFSMVTSREFSSSAVAVRPKDRTGCTPSGQRSLMRTLRATMDTASFMSRPKISGSMPGSWTK
ncbi:MAG: hypothetical protein BWY88_01473 [Synergistetes bacterium ADurb.Bin520]|nr:MAG: hypothetical protein BWY88_01473 [Synergistetes bacterium ADurb.Bin520]